MVKMRKIVTCVLFVLDVTRGDDLLDHALLGQALQGQRDWEMRNWDSATGTRYRDSGTGTCGTGTFL